MPKTKLTALSTIILVGLSMLLMSTSITAQCSNNLLSNGNFENGNAPWDGNYTIVYDNALSSNVVEVCSAGTNARNTISATPGQSYTLTTTAKKPNNIAAFIRMKFMNSSYTPIAEEFAFLNNGGYQEYTINGTAPANAAFVEISIQQNGGGTGCVRADEACLTTGVVNPSLPDLTVEAVVPVVTSVQAGEIIGVSWEVVNTGEPVPFADLPIEVGVYLSSDQTVSSNDLLLSTSIMGLGSNSGGGTIPANFAPGLYYFLIDADNTNVITESNENNNVGVSQQRVTVTGDGGGGDGEIDLSLSLFQSPQTPTQWSTYSVNARIENDGPQTATGVKVSFPKPDGVVYTGGNEYSASQGSFALYNGEVWNVGSIPAGGFATLTVNYFLKVPESPIAYAQVIAANEDDADSTPNNGTPPTVNEDDEANGGGGGPSNDKPDLLTSFPAVASNMVMNGETIVLEFDLINQGDATASGDYIIGLYFSEDFILSNDDILIGSVLTGNTGVGTIPDVQASAAIPENASTGNYWILVKVDDNNDIAETDETNNVKTRSIQVFNPPPPPPPGDGCGFEEVIANVTDATYGIVATESSTGYEVIAQRRIFTVGSLETETHTIDVDLEGITQNITSVTEPVVTSGFQRYTSNIDVDAQVMVVTRNLEGGGIDWTTNIDLSTIGEEVVGLSSTSYADTPDGTIAGLSLVMGPLASVTFNEMYVKLDSDGTVVNQDYSDDLNGQYFFSGWMIGNNGYVLNTQCPGSCLGFIGVDFNGNFVWEDSHAGDLPSNSVNTITLGPDKNFAYAANRNNQQCFIAKYNVATGENVYTTNINTLYAFGGDYQVASYFVGLIFTDDGGIISGCRYFDTGPGDDKYDYGKIDANGDLVWVRTIDAARLYRALMPTSDGGFLFAEEVGGQISLLKTNSVGELDPACDGSTPPPSGNDLPCDLSYTLENGTMTISGPGLNTGHLIVKLFDPSWNTVFSCVDNCGDPIVINNVTMNGNYHFSVNTYNPNWSPICDGLVDVSVGGSNRLGEPTAEMLRVYPNPARDYVTIDASQFPQDDIQLILVDQLGKMVPSGKLRRAGSDHTYQVDLAGLQDGMYTVWIQREGKKIIAKRLVVMSGR